MFLLAPKAWNIQKFKKWQIWGALHRCWTQVKSEFEPSSGVICVAPKRFRRWSPFNSEPPSDHRSNFDLGSNDEYRDTIAAKFVGFKSYPVQKTSSYRIIRIIRRLMQLYWWSGYVRFLLYSFYVLFLLDKLTNRWINCIFWWWCLAAIVNIRSNPYHSNKNSFVSIYKTLNLIILANYMCYICAISVFCGLSAG